MTTPNQNEMCRAIRAAGGDECLYVAVIEVTR
jgi:hypothetical protein